MTARTISYNLIGIIGTFTCIVIFYILVVNPYVNPTPDIPLYVQPTVAKLLTDVNAERIKAHVAPLVEDPRFDQSAQYKASDMLARNYDAHEDPVTGKDNGLDYLWSLEGIKATCSYISENLDMVTGPGGVASYIVKNWMDSPPHREAILNPKYVYTGFGIAISKDHLTTYAVEHFCQPV